MHHAPFGDGVQRQAVKAAVGAQPCQKILVKEALAAAPGLAAQVVDVIDREVRLAHPVEQPLQPGADAVAGFVRAIVRVAAEEMVKLDMLLMQPVAIVKLRHGELIEIGEENALGNALFSLDHGSIPFGLPVYCDLIIAHPGPFDTHQLAPESQRATL